MLKWTLFALSSLFTLPLYALKTSHPVSSITIEKGTTKWCHVNERGEPDLNRVAGWYSQVFSGGHCIAHIDIGQKAILEALLSMASSDNYLEITFGKNHLIDDAAKNLRIINPPKKPGRTLKGYLALNPNRHVLLFEEGYGDQKVLSLFYKRKLREGVEEKTPSKGQLLFTAETSARIQLLELLETFEDGGHEVRIYQNGLTGPGKNHLGGSRRVQDNIRLFPLVDEEPPVAQAVHEDFGTDVVPLVATAASDI